MERYALVFLPLCSDSLGHLNVHGSPLSSIGTLVLPFAHDILARFTSQFNPRYSSITILRSWLPTSTHRLFLWLNPLSIFASRVFVPALRASFVNSTPHLLLQHSFVCTTRSLCEISFRPSILAFLGVTVYPFLRGGCDHVSNAHGGCTVYPIFAMLLSRVYRVPIPSRFPSPPSFPAKSLLRNPPCCVCNS